MHRPHEVRTFRSMNATGLIKFMYVDMSATGLMKYM